MYIFLILYIFLIIPLLNNKFDKKIIFVSSLIFILSITFLREMQRATPTDFHNYFNAIEGTDTFLRFKSPTFGFFIDIFKDVFGLSSIVTYQLICLIPIICIFLSAFILRSYLLIPLFISSETFVLSSFNATRQGLAIGFLSLSLAFFIKEIIESKKVKIISYIKVIGFATVSFLSHESAIVVFSIVILSTVFKRFIKILISLRIEKKKVLFLILGLLLTSFFAFLQGNIFNSVTERIITSPVFMDINNLVPREGYGLSHINSVYRFTIMYLIYFYSLITLKKFDFNEENNNLKYFLESLNFAFVPLIILTLFLPPYILSRFSHYYILPIFGMVYFLNKNIDSRRTFIYQIFTIIGLITYSSKSVIATLYTIQ